MKPTQQFIKQVNVEHKKAKISCKKKLKNEVWNPRKMEFTIKNTLKKLKITEVEEEYNGAKKTQ